jgi:hypothetical protein
MQRSLVSATSAARRSFSMLNHELKPTPPSMTSWRDLGPMGPYFRDQPSTVEADKKFFGHTRVPTFEKGSYDGFINTGVYVSCAAGLLMLFSGEWGCTWPGREHAPLSRWCPSSSLLF